MDAVKPLIFVQPLSPTLQKLKEVSEESAEADGVEIYEIDDMTEFNHLFPTVGQSVCVFSDAKKCARALQSNKKTMKSIHSKVILISPKKIPPKTLEKFDKVGLTECIIEPVAPKTLMYKVKLQLRSIKAQSTDDEEDEKTFSRNEAKKKEEENNYYRGKKEDQDEESVDYRKKYNKREQQEEASDKENNGHSYNEQQDSHWKGKLQKGEDYDESDREKKERYKEEAINTHYKGKSKQSELEFDDELYNKEKAEYAPEEDDELDDIKKSLSLEIEQATSFYSQDRGPSEDEQENRKRDKSLELEGEEATKKKPTSSDKIDSHMKGDLHGEIDSEEKNQEHDSTRDHLEDDKMRGDLDGSTSPEEEEDNERRPRTQLEIEAAEKKKKDGPRVEEQDGAMKHDSAPIHDDNGHLTDEKQRKSKNIEKYIKGTLSHLNEETEDDEYIDNETKLNLEAAKKEEEATGIGEEDESDEEERKRDHKLDLSPGTSKPKEQEESPEENQTSPYAQNSSSANEESIENSQKAASSLDEQMSKDGRNSDEYYNEETAHGLSSHKNSEQDKNSKSRDFNAQDKNEKPKEAQRADNRADRLKKHYKGKGNRHEEQGWGNLHQRQPQNDDDFGAQKQDEEIVDNDGEFKPRKEEQTQAAEGSKKQGPSYSVEQEGPKNAGELHYAQDELGEQTIDYAKLKDEFDAIPYDLKDKKKIWTEYEGKDKKTSDVSITDAENPDRPMDTDPSLLGPEVDSDFSEETDISDDEGESVFEPFSCGLEEVIRNQQFYHDSDMTYKDFLLRMAEKIRERHSGLTSFYSLKQNAPSPIQEICPFEHILPSERGGELHEKWEELKAIKLPFWQQMRLPAWSDKTFQDQELDFYYPYFDHNKFMGFAVVYFSNGLKESESATLEVLLESARGFYTEHYYQASAKDHENSQLESQKIQSIENHPTQKRAGFFSKLFGKKAS